MEELLTANVTKAIVANMSPSNIIIPKTTFSGVDFLPDYILLR